jgi:3-dehydroquinate synthase
MIQSSNPTYLRSIFIYGPPGSGKTTLGRRLAEGLNLPFYDLDEMIVDRAGLSIPEIFSEEGESGFRNWESRLLNEVLEEPQSVVALGGGALETDENRSRVEAAGRVICLTAPFETLLMRSQAHAGQRPLLLGDSKARLEDLLERRAEHYGSFELRLDNGELPLESAVWEAQLLLGAFRVSGMGDGYDVRVVPGGVDCVGSYLRHCDLKGPIAVITDDNVGPLYAERVLDSCGSEGYQVNTLTIRAGEEHKTLETVHHLWDGLLVTQLERGSIVVALGGGVVGDLAGFAAATYMRGIPWIVLPTSLLAMVDASLGGKTGADLPQGKNLVGAFHPPSLVLADSEALATLPKVELRNGLAEVVKHGVIGDPKLFDLCSQGWEALSNNWDEVVRRGMAVKVRIIQEDPFERGVRAALNLGHTLGHAIELVSRFQLKHGEAVAIGMVAAARLSEKIGMAELGLVEKITFTLSNLGLPTQIPDGMDNDQILAAMSHDKKRRGGKARFVLPAAIGEVRWGIEIDDQRMNVILS